MSKYEQYAKLVYKMRQLWILAKLNPQMKGSILKIAQRTNIKAKVLEADLVGPDIA